MKKTAIACLFTAAILSTNPVYACIKDNLGPTDCAKRCMNITGFFKNIACTLGSDMSPQ